MAVLFTGSLVIPAGLNVRTAVVVPGGIKQAGRPLVLQLTVDTSVFPTGTTTITIGLSIDGGLSYRTGGVVVNWPADRTADLIANPIQPITYSLGKDDVVTHTRLTTTAPSAFTLPVTMGAT